MQEEEVPLPKFEPAEKVCGNCKLWSPHSVDPRGWVGPCRMQPQRGLFPPSAPVCDKFAARGVASGASASASGSANSVSNTLVPSGSTRSRVLRNIAPTVVRKDKPIGTVSPAHLHEEIDLEGLTMTREELMDLFREAAGDAHSAPLANKWEGGVVQLVPGNKDLQAKEIPIDSLFHKVVMIRDRLRTLEQKINANTKLSDGEKVELQHYVTRCYGSLTTFNVLFREKGDFFVGEKGSGE